MTFQSQRSVFLDTLCEEDTVKDVLTRYFKPKDYFHDGRHFIQFFHHFYGHVGYNDLLLMQKSRGTGHLFHLAAVAAQVFQKGIQQNSCVQWVDLSPDQEHFKSYALMALNIDRPFLVDSLKLFFSKKKLAFDVLIHPIFSVKRNHEGALVSVSEHMTHTGAIRHQHHESLMCVVFSNVDHHAQTLLDTWRSELNDVMSLIGYVDDGFTHMRHRLTQSAQHFSSLSNSEHFPDIFINKTSLQEISAFLHWLNEEYFVFLGARYFAAHVRAHPFYPKKDADEGLTYLSNDALTLVFDTDSSSEESKNALGIFQSHALSETEDLMPCVWNDHPHVSHESVHRARKTGDASTSRSSLPFFVIRKSARRSVIHKPSRIESIELLDVDEHGTICGVHQFVGVFTKRFFTLSPFDIPLLSHRVERVFSRFQVHQKSYDGKKLIAILNSMPQDELFHFCDDELFTVCERILYNQNDVITHFKLDPEHRFATVAIFLPREKYTASFADALQDVLVETIGGEVDSFHPFIEAQSFARIFCVLSFRHTPYRSYGKDGLEGAINQLALNWEERLSREIQKTLPVSRFADVQGVFPSVYQKTFTPIEAAVDFTYALRACYEKKLVAAIRYHQTADVFTLQVFHPGNGLSLSKLMPIFDCFGLEVLSETGYQLSLSDHSIYVHNFLCVRQHDFDGLHAEQLLEAFLKVWHQKIENDHFNELVLKAGLDYVEVTWLRAYSRCMRHMNMTISLDSIASTLCLYPDYTRLLIDYFKVRFDPHIDNNERKPQQILIEKDLLSALDTINRQDHDRILRALLTLMKATLRTSAFKYDMKKDDAPCLVFKFRSHDIPFLPKPVPLYDVFLYSTFMEGIHLRAGKVARGGIRWSDRLDDFRQEILGLVKTQMVKNAVIVPLGAKGGFTARNYESLKQTGADAETLKQEVVRCYTAFISGLLDITDTYVQGICQKPPNVVVYDKDDPYFVVAADKGTAAFSDTANALSSQYNFWLDDAFASGGSFGYDHKKMAITSRGAWISVQTHFQNLDYDIQSTPFSVVGIGDMSGDIFGNGMLLSRHTCLKGAFNHSHIFVDPHPDPSLSYDERERLFNLPSSTWADYNTALLSRGGGIFKRSDKTLLLSAEIRHMLDIPKNLMTITPDSLIVYLLKAPVDLLWFGGIGTYIKASYESHFDVHDTSNDAIRVDGLDIRARVIVEGANLGITQKGRIECAHTGVHLNTDAIDNSGGVDCSDHEVNIKILFSDLMRSGALTRDERNTMLVDMTGDIAERVLENNRQQNKVLTYLEQTSAESINAYGDLVHFLEKDTDALLNRTLESIPTDEEFKRRHDQHKGMTRPELAVLMAYSKILLYRKLVPVVEKHQDHPLIHTVLCNYFPALLTHQYRDAILRHHLRCEIVATVLSNRFINHLGPIDALAYVRENKHALWHRIQTYCTLTSAFH